MAPKRKLELLPPGPLRAFISPAGGQPNGDSSLIAKACISLCVHTKENLSLAAYRACGQLDFLNFMHVYSIPWPHPSPHPTSPNLSSTYLPFLSSFISLKITHPIQSVLPIGVCVESPPPRHRRVTVPPSAAISGL